MHEQESCMHQVKSILRKLVGEKVVAADLDLIGRQRFEEACVEIDRKHRARGANTLGKHLRDRSPAGPDVQTAPPLADPDGVQLPGGQGIVVLLHQPQTRPFEIQRALLREEIFAQGGWAILSYFWVAVLFEGAGKEKPADRGLFIGAAEIESGPDRDFRVVASR